jgi:hypothetical protein
MLNELRSSLLKFDVDRMMQTSGAAIFVLPDVVFRATMLRDFLADSDAFSGQQSVVIAPVIAYASARRPTLARPRKERRLDVESRR